MDLRQLTPDYAVAPQIAVTDLPEIAAAGFTTLICNRPDHEIPPSLHADAMQAAAEAAGLTFALNPVTHQTLSLDMAYAQRAAIDASAGPSLAYCASGTRSTIVWALGQAKDTPSEVLIAAAAAQGYDIVGLSAKLDQLFEG